MIGSQQILCKCFCLTFSIFVVTGSIPDLSDPTKILCYARTQNTFNYIRGCFPGLFPRSVGYLIVEHSGRHMHYGCRPGPDRLLKTYPAIINTLHVTSPLTLIYISLSCLSSQRRSDSHIGNLHRTFPVDENGNQSM